MAFSTVRFSLALSQTKSRATNIPTVNKSPVSSEMSKTVYLLSRDTLVAWLKVRAEPLTSRLMMLARRLVSGDSRSTSYKSPRTGIGR